MIKRRILLVEDCAEDAALAKAMLRRSAHITYVVDHATDVEAAAKQVAAVLYDVVVLDLELGPYSGLEALAALSCLRALPPVIVLSGQDDVTLAINAVREGAQDFLFKQTVTSDLFARSIEYALERCRLQSEVRDAHAEVERLVVTDPLTGLANRRGLSIRLNAIQATARREGSSVCAALIDCDDFKSVNDAVGHAGGDAVLKRVAHAIFDTVRPVDVAARIGGDEFLILFADSRIHEALAAAERVRCRLASETVGYKNHSLTVRVSTGVASIPRHVTSIEQLLPLLGLALKASKDQGKNQVRALLADRGLAVQATLCRPDRAVNYLRPFHQPIVDLVGRQSVAHEMLTRGPHGPCEMPLDMFQAAHEQGILANTDLTCFTACAESAMSLHGGASVHINLYPSTMEAVGPEPIRLAMGALPPTRVCIELSEPQLSGSQEGVLACVDELRRHGVRFAVSDIGFGKSSLESLVILEPDFVKLDRSMVLDVSTSRVKTRRLGRLVRAIGHLRQTVIAAGVETEQDLGVLADIGIHLGQGFLLGRPAPVRALETQDVA